MNPQSYGKTVRNPLNSDTFKKNHEKNDLPSLTVPDEGMTVREIMEKFANGYKPIDVEAFYSADFDEDQTEVLPRMKSLDYAEQQQFVDELAQEISTIQSQWEKSKNDLNDKDQFRNSDKAPTDAASE